MNDCIFCKIANNEINSLKLYEDDIIMAFMDINPICDGHILIVPKDHYETVFDLPNDIMMHMYEIAKKLLEKTKIVTSYDGGSISFNIGHMQEVKHAHMHIMPNFKEKPTKSVEEIYNLLMEN